MACVKPDGSLTALGRQVLTALDGHTVQDAVLSLQLPVYRVRSLARALEELNLVKADEQVYQLTSEGQAKLVQSAG